jgi:DnaJ-class molecular chaperone
MRKDIKLPILQNRFEELMDDEDIKEEDLLRPRTKDINISLNVTLEEFYHGKEKKLAIRRKRIKKDAKGR